MVERGLGHDRSEEEKIIGEYLRRYARNYSFKSAFPTKSTKIKKKSNQ